MSTGTHLDILTDSRIFCPSISSPSSIHSQIESGLQSSYKNGIHSYDKNMPLYIHSAENANFTEDNAGTVK